MHGVFAPCSWRRLSAQGGRYSKHGTIRQRAKTSLYFDVFHEVNTPPTTPSLKGRKQKYDIQMNRRRKEVGRRARFKMFGVKSPTKQ
jgi:hypothetical protein